MGLQARVRLQQPLHDPVLQRPQQPDAGLEPQPLRAPQPRALMPGPVIRLQPVSIRMRKKMMMMRTHPTTLIALVSEPEDGAGLRPDRREG